MIFLTTLFVPAIVYLCFAVLRAFVKWDKWKMWDISTWSDGARAVFIFCNVISIFVWIEVILL